MTREQMTYAMTEALPDCIFGNHGTNWQACPGGESYGYFYARADMSMQALVAALRARYPGLNDCYLTITIYLYPKSRKYAPEGYESHYWRARG